MTTYAQSTSSPHNTWARSRSTAATSGHCSRPVDVYNITPDASRSNRSFSPPGYTKLRPQGARPGLLAKLPRHIQSIDSTSIIHTQPWIEAGAGGHPILIVDILPGNLALALQCTSWTQHQTGCHLTVQQKWSCASEPSKWRRQYLAINHTATSPHDNLPVLHMENKKLLQHQTYINMTNFFTIELHNLEPIDSNWICLEQTSLYSLTAYFDNFLEGRIWRPAPSPNHSTSPLDLGVKPTLSPQAQLAAKLGHQAAMTGTSPFSRPNSPPPQQAWSSLHSARWQAQPLWLGRIPAHQPPAAVLQQQATRGGPQGSHQKRDLAGPWRPECKPFVPAVAVRA